MHRITPNIRSTALPLLLVLTVFALLAQFSWSFGQGLNNRNVSVDTEVNITGSPPVVQSVVVGGSTNVTLTAGFITYLTCNATVRDWNGWADPQVMNATLFHSSSTENAADNNNTHYTNASCAKTDNDGNYLVNYTCAFPVNYYALNGSWNCTVHVNDTFGLNGAGSGKGNISSLYALNVTVLIDYGNLSAGEYSNNQTANITNLGNVPINISVLGYGGNNIADITKNLSFFCDQGNLSVGLQHFSTNPADNYAAKQVLSNTSRRVTGLTINKTTNASYSYNTTYWELYIDPVQVAFGRCNGTVVFQAETV